MNSKKLTYNDIDNCFQIIPYSLINKNKGYV